MKKDYIINDEKSQEYKNTPEIPQLLIIWFKRSILGERNPF